ncbi:hypothetical protein [Streptomyces sp. NPDC047097]|uniref:hypothetical protein n=1 Tax=Streptomyces sp. NPDC047097 TaxID=3155260 RepID=UPI0033E7259E
MTTLPVRSIAAVDVPAARVELDVWLSRPLPASASPAEVSVWQEHAWDLMACAAPAACTPDCLSCDTPGGVL